MTANITASLAQLRAGSLTPFKRTHLKERAYRVVGVLSKDPA